MLANMTFAIHKLLVIGILLCSACGSWVGNPGVPDSPGGENDENPIVKRQEDTQFEGRLNLLASDGLEMPLTQGLEGYRLECVTTSLDSQRSCSGMVGPLGYFEFPCRDFAGSKFACYLQKNEGSESRLVKGVFLSDQLTIARASARVTMGLDYVSSLNFGSISRFSQFSNTGEQLPTEVETDIHPSLRSLAFEPGSYQVCFFPEADQEQVTSGSVDPIDFDQCSGLTRSYYIDYSASEEGLPPSISFWRDEESKKLCTDDSGKISYDISNGNRSFEFKEDQKVNFIELFSFLYNDGSDSLMPQASIDILENFSHTSSIQSYDEDFSTLLSDYYGSNSCGKIKDDIQASLESAELLNSVDGKRCMNLSYETGNIELNRELQQKVDPELCILYKQASSEQQTFLLDDFEVDCRKKYLGEADFQFEQKRYVTNNFLYMLSKQRHFSADQLKFELRDAYQTLSEFEPDLSSAQLESDLFESACDDGPLDLALAHFIGVWQEEDWDQNRSKILQLGLDGQRLVCSPISFRLDNEQINVENGGQLLAYLLLNPIDKDLEIDGLEEVESSVCANDWLYDFTRLDVNAQYYHDLWMASNRTQGMLVFRPEVNEEARKDTLSRFLTGILGLNGSDPLVFGCSAHHMRGFLKMVEGSQTSMAEILENFGWRLVEARYRSEIIAINISPYSGDSPLTALDEANFERKDELAKQEVIPFAGKVVKLSLSWFDDLGSKLNEVCKYGVELSSLEGVEEDISCGKPVPEKFQGKGFCRGLESCQFEELALETDFFGLLRGLALFIAQVKATRAFELDPDFRKSLLKVNTESQCLPDASVAFQGFVDEQSQLNHEVLIRGPVARDIGGLIQADIIQTQGLKQSFFVENSLLNVDRTVGQRSCYEGLVNRLRRLQFWEDGVLTGVKANGYGNTCEESMLNGVRYHPLIARPND